MRNLPANTRIRLPGKFRFFRCRRPRNDIGLGQSSEFRPMFRHQSSCIVVSRSTGRAEVNGTSSIPPGFPAEQRNAGKGRQDLKGARRDYNPATGKPRKVRRIEREELGIPTGCSTAVFDCGLLSLSGAGRFDSQLIPAQPKADEFPIQQASPAVNNKVRSSHSVLVDPRQVESKNI